MTVNINDLNKEETKLGNILKEKINLTKAIRLREHLTGKGGDTFENASLKDKWLSLAEDIIFKDELSAGELAFLGKEKVRTVYHSNKLCSVQECNNERLKMGRGTKCLSHTTTEWD